MKEQKIKEAYGEHYEEVSKFIDDMGWCVRIDYSGVGEIINHRNLNDMGFVIGDERIDCGYFSEEFKLKWRPKSLKELENNNGWVKIENESDLPKSNSEYKVGTLVGDKFYRSSGVLDMFEVALSFSESQITHYYALKELENPIY